MNAKVLSDIKHSTVHRLHFRIGEMARMLEVSTRQLRYWEQKGYLKAIPRENNEKSRLFGFDAFMKANALKSLMDKGYSLQQAIQAVENVAENGKVIHDIMSHTMHDIVTYDDKIAVMLGEVTDITDKKLIAYFDGSQTRYELVEIDQLTLHE